MQCIVTPLNYQRRGLCEVKSHISESPFQFKWSLYYDELRQPPKCGLQGCVPGFVSKPLIGRVGGEVGGVASSVILWRVRAVRLDLWDICKTRHTGWKLWPPFRQASVFTRVFWLQTLQTALGEGWIYGKFGKLSTGGDTRHKRPLLEDVEEWSRFRRVAF